MQKKFEEMTLKQYNDLLASRAPTPGGGSALCQIGAIACSLIEMAINITMAKLDEEDENRIYLNSQKDFAERAKKTLYRLSDEDSAAFQNIVDGLKLPKTTDEEKKNRTSRLQKAYHCAALVPLNVMELCREVLKLCRVRIMPLLSKYVSSDCIIASDILHSVIKNSMLNVHANTALIADEALASSLNKQGERIIEEIKSL